MSLPQAEERIKLTSFSHGAGCGCKIAPDVLEEILKGRIGQFQDPRLLVGYGTRDDAAVFDLGDGRAIISTTDFFSPIVDDAFGFGRVAATNALSDIYAMGGRPLMAVAILGWPVDKLPAQLASEVLDGGRKACHDAGISLAGGHSIDAPEPFFGLAVTGEVAVENIKRNNTARAGDVLILTKPLGLGILATARKRGRLRPEHEHIALEIMCASNKIGSVLGEVPEVHAMTDVTGFGLLGHLLEICDGSNLSAVIDHHAVPTIPEALIYLAEGCYPDGTFRNWKSQGNRTTGAGTMEKMMVLSDPQTSGGLLISADPKGLDAILLKLKQNSLCSNVIGELHAEASSTTTIKILSTNGG